MAERTKILQDFLKALKTSEVTVHIYKNQSIIFPSGYTLFFYLENRVIIHNRNTQIRYDFNVFSITQLLTICSYFGVYSKRLKVNTNIFKWLYIEPLPSYLSVSNPIYKKIKINYK